jgi:hypothetical protein
MLGEMEAGRFEELPLAVGNMIHNDFADRGEAGGIWVSRGRGDFSRK